MGTIAEAITVKFTVNGRGVSVETNPDRTLLDVLREDLHLTGTKYGCGESRCGACTVLIDGQRAFSCQTGIAGLEGKHVRTIEGLAEGDRLHPVQEAFLAENAFQCGFCTPGMIMNAVALLKDKPHPSDAEIVQWMDRSLCRCCSYVNIVEAIKRAAAGMGR